MVARLSKCIFPDSNWPGEYCFVRSPEKVVLLNFFFIILFFNSKCELILLSRFTFARKKAQWDCCAVVPVGLQAQHVLLLLRVHWCCWELSAVCGSIVQVCFFPSETSITSISRNLPIWLLF